MVAELLFLAVASQCDLQHQVAERLHALRPSAATPVHVELHDGLLRVELGGRSRTVPSSGSCEDDAAVAAVIAATWLVPVPAPVPAPVAKKPAPVVEVASAPVEAEAPLDEAQPLVSSETAPAPAPAPASEPASLSAVVLPLPGPLPRGGAGVALSLTAIASANVSAQVAATVRLGVDVGRTWGLLAELDLASERGLPAGAGEIRWWRPALSVGPRVRFERGAWFVEPSLSLTAGLLVLRGVNTPGAANAVGGTAGACAAARAGRSLTTHLSAFASLGGCAWPLSSTLVVTGLWSGRVPWAEASLGAGVSWSVQ